MLYVLDLAATGTDEVVVIGEICEFIVRMVMSQVHLADDILQLECRDGTVDGRLVDACAYAVHVLHDPPYRYGMPLPPKIL